MLQPVSTQHGYPVLPLRVLKEAWMGAEEVGREVGDWEGGRGRFPIELRRGMR